MMKSGRSQKTNEKKTFLLIDGNSFCYRAYYAIRQLSNSKGEPTNAIYGFMAILYKLLELEKPDYVAVCFDRKEPTFRHQQYGEYKAHRKPMPEDLVEQMEPIKELCCLNRLAVFEKAGFEADDLIGTLAKAAEKKGLHTYIVTGDKDAMQLVNENIQVLNPHKDNRVIGIKEVRERFDGLGPEKVVEIMALMGDASDNIPGIQGFGEKTALKLIHQFGNIETLISQADSVKSKSQRELIKKYAEDAKLSRRLAEIDTEVDLNLDWDAMAVKEPETEKLQAFYERYEFRNQLKGLAVETKEEKQKRNYRVVQTQKDFEIFIENLKKEKLISVDTETTSEDPMRAELVGMSFSWKEFEAYYIPILDEKLKTAGLPKKQVLEALKPVLESLSVAKIGQNAKYDWMVLKRAGVTLNGLSFDTMIASYLINPVKLNHNLDDISFDYLGVKKIPTEALMGSGKNKISMAEVPVEKIAEYAAEDADCVFRLKPILEQKLKEHALWKLFQEVEIPLSLVLAKMEMNGVRLDVDYLKKMSDDTEKDLSRLTKGIYDLAGEEFNINSPKQLSEILFQKLKLPAIKKTKTGFSTDVGVLERLALTHELPKSLLEYREKSKLKSTYLDALPEMIHPETKRVHTSYHQTTTVTGRLSSSDPNLQNIPIKTEAGRLIRKGFIPAEGPGTQILSADYSQIELRILAHFSEDENLIQAFKEDRDIHKFTATLLYGVPEKEVTRIMRNVAKVINFSIIYGKTAYGLSQDLGISPSEADEFIQNYFKRYRAVRDYLESQKQKAREQGYLTTFLGRRAYFPDIHSKNIHMRQFAERAAVNAPLQGSAADLVKLAMIAVQTKIEEKGLRSLMTMQVHDELVFDAKKDEIDTLSRLVRQGMEHALTLKVPLKVDLFTGDNWYKE